MKGLIEWIKKVIGEKAAAVLLSQIITKDNIVKVVTDLLNIMEELAAKTETTIDDDIVKKLKEVLNIDKKEA